MLRCPRTTALSGFIHVYVLQLLFFRSIPQCLAVSVRLLQFDSQLRLSYDL